jgi:hypothetical protein
MQICDQLQTPRSSVSNILHKNKFQNFNTYTLDCINFSETVLSKIRTMFVFFGVPGHTDLPSNLSFDAAAEESIVLGYVRSD